MDLTSGYHAWVWPLPPSLAVFEKMCTDAKALGLAGLMPQQGLDTAAWLQRQRGRAQELATQNGLQLTVGFGMDGHNAWRGNLSRLIGAIADGLSQTQMAMLNWETRWEDDRDDREQANMVVDGVLRKVGEAAERCVDAPWWDPLFQLRKGVRHPTHPNAPTREFGRLCKGNRYVQVYGANVKGSPDGASAGMLRWSRDATQYPFLGFSAAKILPSVQAYGRTVKDHLTMFLKEPNGCLWHFARIAKDKECLTALRIVKALRDKGFSGPDAVANFQASAGLPKTGIGPNTTAALGVPIPPGVIWRRE